MATDLEVSSGVSFLCVNEAREHQGILDEEYRCVVANEVPDAFFCVELDGESARIPVCALTITILVE